MKELNLRKFVIVNFELLFCGLASGGQVQMRIQNFRENTRWSILDVLEGSEYACELYRYFFIYFTLLLNCK